MYTLDITYISDIAAGNTHKRHVHMHISRKLTNGLYQVTIAS